MCAVDEKFDVDGGGTADAFYAQYQALAAEQKKKQAEKAAGQKRKREENQKATNEMNLADLVIMQSVTHSGAGSYLERCRGKNTVMLLVTLCVCKHTWTKLVSSPQSKEIIKSDISFEDVVNDSFMQKAATALYPEQWAIKSSSRKSTVSNDFYLMINSRVCALCCVPGMFREQINFYRLWALSQSAI